MRTPDDPVFIAAIDLIKRTGARDFQLRYCEEEEPVVWIAVASYSAINGRPRATGKINAHKVGAAMGPIEAVMKLLDEAVDGAMCTHCGRPTGVAEDWEDEMPLDEYVCWYRFDPELKTFRRSCEGDT